MSWLEPVAGTNRVALRFARFEGRWSQPKTIAESADIFVNWADFPSITADGEGNLFAHWLQKSGKSTYAYDVRYAVSSNDGRTWSAPMLLNRDGKQTEHGFASIVPHKAGGFAAVWLDGRQMPENSEEGEMSLRFALLDPAGRMQRDVLLDKRTCECCATALARTEKGFVVAYRDRNEIEIRDISVIRINGDSATAPMRVHADEWKIAGCPVNGPQIDARGSRVALAWFTAANGQPRMNVAFSSDAGATFAAPIRADSGAPLGRVDVLLLPDGDSLVVWMEGSQILIRRVSPSGKLGPIVKLTETSSSRSSGFPRAVLIGKKAWFAWTDAGTPKRVRIASADLAGF